MRQGALFGWQQNKHSAAPDWGRNLFEKVNQSLRRVGECVPN